MPNEIKRLLRLSEGCAKLDGSAIKLKMEFLDAESATVEMQQEAIQDTIQYLVYLAMDAAAKRNAPTSFKRDERINVAPIPASHMGLMLGEQGSAIVLLNLHGLRLGFQLPLEELLAARASFAQIVETLASEPKATN